MGTYLPLAEQSFPSEHAALAQAFQTSASWVWTQEDQHEAPYAPPDVQRGFRWSHVSTQSSRTPSSLTIILSADNYFSLHVNGALVHAPNSKNELWDAFAFTVPIPAGTTNTVIAVRGINADDTVHTTRNPAGITAAIKLSFQGTTETETFLTGSDSRWVGEKSLPAGWENPDFNDSNWPNVVVYPSATANSIWSANRRRGPSQLLVSSGITGGTTTSTRTSTLTSTSTILASASITSSQALTSSTPTGTPAIGDIPPPEDPTALTAGLIGTGSSNSSNTNSAATLSPSPCMSVMVVAFILFFTLWPRPIRRMI